MPKFKTMRSAIKAHEAAGGYFFSQGALDFFTSQIHHDTYQPETGLFITSEIMGLDDDVPRTYAVRRIDLDNPARVDSMDGRYDTLQQAMDRRNHYQKQNNEEYIMSKHSRGLG